MHARELICFGERCHEPSWTPERAARWLDLWLRHGYRAAMATPAMAHGATRARLLGLLGAEPSLIVNLLPPDPACGSWDPVLAATIAGEIVRHLAGRPVLACLLGRKVAIAFGLGRARWCALRTTRALDQGGSGIPAVVIPHPSGRNRILSDPGWREKIQAAVRVDLRGVTP